MKWESYAQDNSERLLKSPHHRHFLRKLIKVFVQTKILGIFKEEEDPIEIFVKSNRPGE